MDDANKISSESCDSHIWQNVYEENWVSQIPSSMFIFERTSFPEKSSQAQAITKVNLPWEDRLTSILSKRWQSHIYIVRKQLYATFLIITHIQFSPVWPRLARVWPSLLSWAVVDHWWYWILRFAIKFSRNDFRIFFSWHLDLTQAQSYRVQVRLVSKFSRRPEQT